MLKDQRHSADASVEKGLSLSYMRFLPSYGSSAEAVERPSSETIHSRHRRQRSAEQRRNPDGFSESLPVQERGLHSQWSLGVTGVAGLAGDAVASGPPPAALWVSHRGAHANCAVFSRTNPEFHAHARWKLASLRLMISTSDCLNVLCSQAYCWPFCVWRRKRSWSWRTQETVVESCSSPTLRPPEKKW